MCNLYQITSNVEAMRTLFSARRGDSPNLAADELIYPNRPAPVVVAEGDGRALKLMLWGVPPPAGVARPITNVRNLASPFWRGLLAAPAQRALVPVSSFCEWSDGVDPVTGKKKQHWFALKDAPLFAFAGVWRPGEVPRFAFLTCAPNALVGAVHSKAMPVILAGEAADAWLAGDAAAAFQQAYPEAGMREILQD